MASSRVCGASREFVSFARVDAPIDPSLAFFLRQTSAWSNCRRISMQAKLERGKAAFRMHGVGLSVAILASATLSLSAPDRALAACGASSHPARRQRSGAGGTHAATSTAATSSGRWRRKPRMRGRVQRLGAARPANCRFGQSDWSPACARRAPKPMRGPLQRGPRTPARICAALDMRIASEAAEESCSRRPFGVQHATPLRRPLG